MPFQLNKPMRYTSILQSMKGCGRPAPALRSGNGPGYGGLAPNSWNGTRRPHQPFLLAFLGLLLAALFAGHHIATWPMRIRYSGDDGTEGIALAEMVHLRRGVPIYSPPSPERFDVANYGPLYYLLGAQLVDPQNPTYLSLRLLSLLAALGSAVGCALLAFWQGRSYLAAALAPLLFLAYRSAARFGTSARCDIVALFLPFAGFLIAYRSRNSRGLFVAAPLMLVGFFYKQQFVAAPLAIVLFLLLEKRYRLAAGFAGALALGGLGLLGFFQFVAFPGQAFLEHFLLYNFLPFTPTRFVFGILFFGVMLLVPLLVGLEFLRLHPNKLLSCYLGCALFLGLLTVAREGSDSNYFLECVLLLSALLAALFAKRIADSPRALELLLLLGVTLFLGQWFVPPAPQPEDFARDRAVQDYLRRNFSPHTPALGYYTGDLVRAGLETPISNLFHYAWLTRQGVLSNRDLVAQLDARRYGVIVLNFDLQGQEDSNRKDYYLIQPLRQTILANYRPAASLEMPGPEKYRPSDRFYAWVPRTPGGD